MSEEFIELHRTFHALPLTKAARDDIDLSQWLGHRGKHLWADLLVLRRVVLLSEAGAGKTEEIRHAARSFHAQGKPAFFLRIEHVRSDFEGAFEVGTHEQFQAWVRSGAEGWVFLDSVDEARLKGAKEFEQAIKRVGRELKPILQQAHIVITGRTAAWRARSDLALCREHLPVEVAPRAAGASASDDIESPAEIDEVDTNDIEFDDESQAPPPDSLSARERDADPNAYQIVALDELHGAQIDTYARAKGVTDVAEFRQAVERKEAEALTARPLDLEELVEFWKAHRRIGTRRELIEASIARRLTERDPDRAQGTNLTPDRLRRGVQLLAAAVTLTQLSDIRLPDAGIDVKGLEGRDILTDWPDADIATLLARPIFGESIYGAVRFHAQRVREYLTAEWLNGLLVHHASRARIEALFFRRQYGREVVVPAMRGILPWLALFDGRILDRIRRVSPEVMFEGGDPSHLPFEIRSSLLREACRQLAGPAAGRTLTDFQSVQRFVLPDLAADIKSLLATHEEDEEVVYFLMRMVWQGEIREAAGEALHVALNSRAHYARIVAMRALQIVGTAPDRAKVRAALLAEADQIARDRLSEALATLPRDAEGVDWLLRALARVEPKERFSVDGLSEAVESFVAELSLGDLPPLVAGLQELLESTPLKDEDVNRVSKRNDWLVGSAIVLLDRLVLARDAQTLDAPAMALLKLIPIAVSHGNSEEPNHSAQLAQHVSLWPELNRALFWRDVESHRLRRLAKSGEAVRDFWGVGLFGNYWRFDASHFDAVEKEITTQPLVDNRHVALSLAFALFRENGRPPRWRARLRRRVERVPELQASLHALLHPNSDQLRRWKQQEATRRRRAAREAAQREAHRLNWVTNLQENVETLRQPPTAAGLLRSQYYLHTRLRELEKNSSRWSNGKWRELIPEFGVAVAVAFRNATVASWRGHSPVLLSEGAEPNTTPVLTIFGLTGLLIESRETPDWAMHLEPAEAELATRYAMCELNGFPPWLPGLYLTHPDAVLRVVLGEIDYELHTAMPDASSHYVLSDASSVGAWMWDRLAPELLIRLRNPSKSAAHVRQQLVILTGSSLSDAQVAVHASINAKAITNDALAALWFASWVGVEPHRALPELTRHLATLPTQVRQADFAMHFVTALLGDRRERRVAREAYRVVPHLQTLHLMMYQYITVSEDIQRAGRGVYSPGLRDDAQDARDSVIALLKEIPGKEAYLALEFIARVHPTALGRDWIANQARQRAEADADLTGWRPGQVRDFHDHLERIPNNHRDLFDLAVDRFLELKYDLEDGETSNAAVLLSPKETLVRNFVADWCRGKASGRYIVPQEEELADQKRPDMRYQSTLFDAPVPVELKLANKWSGPDLVERLENQLCNDYLRDKRSSRGIFLLIYQGGKSRWDLPDDANAHSFDELVSALQCHWDAKSPAFPDVDEIRVIGIDLTERGQPKGRSSRSGKTPSKAGGKRSAT